MAVFAAFAQVFVDRRAAAGRSLGAAIRVGVASLVAALLGGAVTRAYPAVIDWRAGVNGAWETPGNWVGGVLPGAADTARNTHRVEIVVSSDQKVKRLETTGRLSLTAGKLEVTPDFLIVSKGTFDMPPASTGVLQAGAVLIDNAKYDQMTGSAFIRSLTVDASRFTLSGGVLSVAGNARFRTGESRQTGDWILNGVGDDRLPETFFSTGQDMLVSHGVFRQNGGTADVSKDLTISVGTYELLGGRLRVIGKLALDGGSLGIGGGTLLSATVHETDRGGIFSATNSASSVLDGVKLATSFFHRQGGTVTVKNGLTGVSKDRTTLVDVAGGSKLVAQGTQPFTSLRFEFAEGADSGIKLTPGTQLTLRQIGISGGESASITIGEKAPIGAQPNRLVFDGFLSASGPVRFVADEITNRASFSSSSAVAGSLEAATLTNERFGAIDIFGPYKIEAATVTNRGRIKLTGGNAIRGTLDVATNAFDNSGKLELGLLNSTATFRPTGGNSQATNSGTIDIARTSKVDFQMGFLQNAGTTAVDGVLAVRRGIFLGGTLTGSGRVEGNVSVAGGVIAPGRSPGLLALEGDYEQSGNSVLAIELEGREFAPEVGYIDYDRLTISGFAQLGGLLDVSVLPGFAPLASDVFTILTAAGGLSGFFDNARPDDLGLPAFMSDSRWTFNVNYHTIPGQLAMVTLSNFSPVSSPSTVMLLGGAWLAAAGRRVMRRRRARCLDSRGVPSNGNEPPSLYMHGATHALWSWVMWMVGTVSPGEPMSTRVAEEGFGGQLRVRGWDGLGGTGPGSRRAVSTIAHRTPVRGRSDVSAPYRSQ